MICLGHAGAQAERVLNVKVETFMTLSSVNATTRAAACRGEHPAVSTDGLFSALHCVRSKVRLSGPSIVPFRTKSTNFAVALKPGSLLRRP